jgi:hypothetical protein
LFPAAVLSVKLTEAPAAKVCSFVQFRKSAEPSKSTEVVEEPVAVTISWPLGAGVTPVIRKFSALLAPTFAASNDKIAAAIGHEFRIISLRELGFLDGNKVGHSPVFARARRRFSSGKYPEFWPKGFSPGTR